MMFAIFISCFLLICAPVSSFQSLSPKRSFKKQQLNMAFDFPLIPAVLLTTVGVFARKFHFDIYLIFSSFLVRLFSLHYYNQCSVSIIRLI